MWDDSRLIKEIHSFVLGSEGLKQGMKAAFHSLLIFYTWVMVRGK